MKKKTVFVGWGEWLSKIFIDIMHPYLNFLYKINQSKIDAIR